MRCQLDNRHGGVAVKSRSSKLVSVSPIRKRLGVRTGRSLRFEDIGVSEREFKMASISMIRMLRCSKINSSLPTTRVRRRLDDSTAASHKPS
jgi:hypothetical protein